MPIDELLDGIGLYSIRLRRIIGLWRGPRREA